MSREIPLRDEQIEYYKKKGILDVNIFLDHCNDREITCWIDEIVWKGKKYIVGYMNADYKSSPTPEIIEWFAKKTNFKYVNYVPTGGDDNSWLFTPMKLNKPNLFFETKEEQLKDEVVIVSGQILTKIFGGI